MFATAGGEVAPARLVWSAPGESHGDTAGGYGRATDGARNGNLSAGIQRLAETVKQGAGSSLASLSVGEYYCLPQSRWLRAKCYPERRICPLTI